jgi:predicted nucleotidyltransferase component of viral defense system
MLHINTIPANTLELLKSIQSVPELRNFNLSGGTALALQIGHRISVDLDFFGNSPFELSEIISLIDKFGTIHLLNQSRNILVLTINGIKVDFVNYKYSQLGDIIHENNIRLFDLQDIGAMKLAAIIGRGRKRDFIDLYLLLQHYSLTELMSFYKQKYPDGSEFLVMRSLTYFEDADKDEDLQMLIPCDWNIVKVNLLEEIQKLNNI